MVSISGQDRNLGLVRKYEDFDIDVTLENAQSYRIYINKPTDDHTGGCIEYDLGPLSTTSYRIDFQGAYTLHPNGPQWHNVTWRHRLESGIKQGQHTLVIEAFSKESIKGQSVKRIFSYNYNTNIVMQPPTISDSDKDLGGQTKAWDIMYYVDSTNKEDTLQTVIKLNNTVISTNNNTPKYTTLVCSITNEMLSKLEFNTTNTITITCTDTDINKSATRIFTFTRVPILPTITGKDENLGVATTDIQEKFVVSCEDKTEQITVVIKVDDSTIASYGVTLGKEYSANISKDYIDKLSNGTHKLTITATGTHNNTTTRTYTFSKNNNAPVISDSDKDLGSKNVGFSINYTVTDDDNDQLTIVEKLNNTTLKTLNNVASNTTETLEISTEQVKKLEINSSNTIEITCTDNKGGECTRTYTFTRVNTSPNISDSDRDLGAQTYSLQVKYTVTDAEQDTVTVKELLDNSIQLNYFTATLNQERTLYIPFNIWIELPNGKHTLSIVATDSNNAKTTRVYSFTKQENKILFNLKKPFQTDAKANRILITPSWYGINNATVLIEVCNNGFDTNPVWEDCTKEVLNNDKYTFQNAKKEANQWGINIKFNITRKEGTTEQIICDGFGGSFE